MDRITEYNVINISIPKGFQSMLLAICANFENVEMQAP